MIGADRKQIAQEVPEGFKITAKCVDKEGYGSCEDLQIMDTNDNSAGRLGTLSKLSTVMAPGDFNGGPDDSVANSKMTTIDLESGSIGRVSGISFPPMKADYLFEFSEDTSSVPSNWTYDVTKDGVKRTIVFHVDARKYVEGDFVQYITMVSADGSAVLVNERNETFDTAKIKVKKILTVSPVEG